jgi:hypothetical protein
MHKKISVWLDKSTRILQDRIARDKTEDTSSYIEELNIRRELVSNQKDLYPPVSIKSIVGHYHLIGANSSNTDVGYMGILTLVEYENRIEATYQLEGSDVQTGFGLLLNNILSLNFNYEIHGKKYTGLVSYEFVSTKIVSGIWVEEGNDEIGVEFARKIPIENTDPLQFFGFN